jgi:uncharacterized protein YciI
MLTHLALAVGLFTVAGAAAIAQKPEGTATAARTYGRANPKKIEGFVVLLRLRQDIYLKWQATGQWPEDDKVANEALAAHGKYWDEQLEAGRALFAGAMGGNYWDNAAIIVVEAASLAEAEALAGNDPAVKSYVFQAQVRPFDVFWLSDKYPEAPR